jgi:aminopeptidase N
MNAKASNIQGKMDRLRAEAEVADAKAKEEGIAGKETELQAELQELQMDWDLAEEGGTERENIQKAIDEKLKDIKDIEDEKKAGEEERIQIEAQAKETKEMEELLD